MYTLEEIKSLSNHELRLAIADQLGFQPYCETAEELFVVSRDNFEDLGPLHDWANDSSHMLALEGYIDAQPWGWQFPLMLTGVRAAGPVMKEATLRQRAEAALLTLQVGNDAANPADFAPPEAKPPLGLMPRGIWLSLRIKDIQDAIKRYEERGLSPNPEWGYELSNLTVLRNSLN